MKKSSIIFFSILMVTIILFGCKNYRPDDRKIAEEFMIRHYASYGLLYSVKKTTYDSETDRFTIHLKESEDNTIKVVIVGVTEGKVTSYDLGNGEGEILVRYDITPKVEISPSEIIIEYNF